MREQNLLLKWLPQFLYGLHHRGMPVRWKGTLAQNSTGMKIGIKGINLKGFHLIGHDGDSIYVVLFLLRGWNADGFYRMVICIIL